jgi:hypothetical protein
MWTVEYRNGFVYVLGYSVGGSIWKLDASDLSTVWEFAGGGALYATVDSEDSVFFTNFFADPPSPSAGVVRKIASDGTEVTTGNFPLELPTATNMYDVAVDDDGNIYACSYQNDAPLTKFDSDGNLLWSVTDTTGGVNNYNASDVVLDSLGRPVITSSDSLACINPSDGSVIWWLWNFGYGDDETFVYTDGKARYLIYSPSADENGNTYWTAQYTDDDFATGEGWLLGKVDQNGNLVWEYVLQESGGSASSYNYYYQSAWGTLGMSQGAPGSKSIISFESGEAVTEPLVIEWRNVDAGDPYRRDYWRYIRIPVDTLEGEFALTDGETAYLYYSITDAHPDVSEENSSYRAEGRLSGEELVFRLPWGLASRRADFRLVIYTDQRVAIQPKVAFGYVPGPTGDLPGASDGGGDDGGDGPILVM